MCKTCLEWRSFIPGITSLMEGPHKSGDQPLSDWNRIFFNFSVPSFKLCVLSILPFFWVLKRTLHSYHVHVKTNISISETFKCYLLPLYIISFLLTWDLTRTSLSYFCLKKRCFYSQRNSQTLCWNMCYC